MMFGIWQRILWWCSYSGFSCPMYLLCISLGSLYDQLGLIRNQWLAKRWKIGQVLSILVLEWGFWRDLWRIITATDNIGRVINDGVGLNRRWHINVINWELKEGSPSRKRCATYWFIGYDNQTRKKIIRLMMMIIDDGDDDDPATIFTFLFIFAAVISSVEVLSMK